VRRSVPRFAHPHSYTETIVGHTTLATGAYPSRHGMVANNWYDRASQQVVRWPLAIFAGPFAIFAEEYTLFNFSQV
jgi:predicted AlkP superfamily pyrophosphatase or phosphodiesterase